MRVEMKDLLMVPYLIVLPLFGLASYQVPLRPQCRFPDELRQQLTYEAALGL